MHVKEQIIQANAPKIQDKQKVQHVLKKESGGGVGRGEGSYDSCVLYIIDPI